MPRSCFETCSQTCPTCTSVTRCSFHSDTNAVDVVPVASKTRSIEHRAANFARCRDRRRDGLTREYADGKMLATKHDGVGVATFNRRSTTRSRSRCGSAWPIFSRLRERRLDPYGYPDRRRDAGVCLGRRHQPVREAPINADAQRAYDEQTSRGARKLATFAKPTIASIRGYCLGGGLAIAMQCDLRIASQDSQFGYRRRSWASPTASKDCGGWCRWLVQPTPR